MAAKGDRPIGMFDSGIGGLTVLNALQKLLPNEKVVYFGDTARLPYGDKSAETILRYSIENSIFLMEHRIKALVIACNTASSVAVEKLGQLFNIPVIGVIQPGAERAAQVTKNGHIAVLGTRATIQSGAYEKELLALLPQGKIQSIACPLFVPLIEEGFHNHAASELIIADYLKPVKEAKVDTLLLGCTHYLALEKAIRNYLGEKIAIVDSASTCAEKIEEILTQEQMRSSSAEKVSHLFYASDNPEKFRLLGQKFMECTIPNVNFPQAFSTQPT
ncbi:MAG: glutamate racemase [Parachlamydiaceae bacterium]